MSTAEQTPDQAMSVDPAATTDVAAVPEFPEVLRGKTDEEIDAIKRKIVEQLAFYFSDSNLFYDKFLWNLVCKSPEGWVPLETVASFKRMREYLTTYGASFLAQCVRDVHPSAGEPGNEIEVDATGERVRRTKSLERDTTAWDRTLYVKGFGEGETGHNSQEQVEEWFKQFASVAAVRFRREGEGREKNKGAFKGSVFVEFKTLADAQAFVDMDPQPSFQGEPVTSMFKEAYVQMKVKEKGLDGKSISRGNNTRPAVPNAKQFNAFREIEAMKAKGERLPEYVMNMGTPALLANAPTEDSSASGNKRKRDGADDAEDAARAEKKAKEDQFLYITYNGKRLAVNRATGVVVDKAEIEFQPGRVLRFENAGPDADWKQLKVDLSNLGYDKSFMNFPRGSTWGWFSLEEPISEEEFEKIKNAKLQANGELQWSRVTGDEELEFWATRASFQGKLAVKQADEKDAENAKAAAESGSRHGGGGGRGRGGRGGGRGGNRGRGGGRGRGGRGGGRGGNRGGNRDRNDNAAAGGAGSAAPNPQSAAQPDAPPAI
ncbi:hypothetical protein QFC19_002794 [Naganishia cerealis]|uniref:Uncharacterized protein n=1 Tax=Naganishia cerealis TaxID=610337 RepID=A0ACC2W7F6_9TREE|nr:hypothetical protein QFC19_002794 [Naganishia cerealis]